MPDDLQSIMENLRVQKLATKEERDAAIAKREAEWDALQERRHAEELAAMKSWQEFRGTEHLGRAWRCAVACRLGAKAAHGDVQRVIDGDIKDTKALGVTRRWMAGTKPILVLAGTPGTGKTVAATWAAIESKRADIEKRLDALRFAEAKDWAEATRNVARQALDQWRPTVLPAARMPQALDPWRNEGEAPTVGWCDEFVLVDDLGTEQLTARWAEVFGEFIDARLACSPERVRTIFTTNLPKSEIRPRYGDRIADRLNAHSLCVELKGESMRGRGQGL